jgi:hypothetical protein
MGLISGYFKKKSKPGRPKKSSIFMNSLPKPNKKKKQPPAESITIDLTVNLTASISLAAKPSSRPSKARQHSKVASSASRSLYAKDTKDTSPVKRKQRSRGIYKNWTKEPYASALSRAVNAHLKGLDPQLAAGEVIIPPSTLRDAVRKHENEKAALVLVDGNEHYAYLAKFDRDTINREEENKTYGLTTEGDRSFLQSIVALRDFNKNGMTRGEVIGIIMVMKLCQKRKAELHFDYLRRNKKLPELKSHGYVQSAQRTTTKRANITTKKLLRWHGTIDDLLMELDRLNSWHPAWAIIKEKRIDHFLGNLDESNMSASAGTVKIIGSADVKKHEKNTDDNRDTITVIRAGMSSGTEGPRT